MKVAKIGLAGLFAVLGVLSASASANETVTYTYDALGRLVTTSVSGTAPTNGQNVTTSFDPAGNRTNYTVSGVGGVVAGAVISVAGASVTEGGQLSFTVTRAGLTSSSNAVNYTSTNGTAVAPGDYTAVSGTLTFAIGETSKTVLANTVDDAIAEPVENLMLDLTGPTNGATLGTATATGTINDNDAPPAQLAIGNASATEGGTLAFTVARSGTTTTAISASYVSASGTALSGSDFNAATGTVSFAANQTSATINVTTIDDTAAEITEAMSVTLSNPSANTSITTASGTGTIADNDSMIVFADAQRTVLPAHTSTYSCIIGGFEGDFWDFCFVNASGVTVYDYWGIPQFDPGYTFDVQGNIQVQTSYYGTGVAP